MNTDEYYMKIALKEAQKAISKEDPAPGNHGEQAGKPVFLPAVCNAAGQWGHHPGGYLLLDIDC